MKLLYIVAKIVGKLDETFLRQCCWPVFSSNMKTTINQKTCLKGGVKKLGSHCHLVDRIPSTTPGAEPPRDAKDSGSARSHSTHLETSSSNRP